MLLNNLFPEESTKCDLKWKRNQWIISSAPRFLESVCPPNSLTGKFSLDTDVFLQQEIDRLRQ